MEGLVNYCSEDEREDSPNRKAAERCPVLEIDPNKRSKGDSSRRHKEEKTRSGTSDRGQGTSQRDKEISHSSFRKNIHKEDSSRCGTSRIAGNRDHYHRSDRRSERTHDKRRDSKDDRKRRDGHRERDRDYDQRDVDRDRRDRSDTYRRERHDKDNSYRDKDRRGRSSESPPPQNKDRNASTSYRNRNRSRTRSRSTSKEYSSHNKPNASTPTAEQQFRGGKPAKLEHKEELTPTPSVSQSKTAINAVVSLPLNDVPPKMPNLNIKAEGTPITLPTYYNPNIINPTKYAEQVKKRKLIWGAKKTEDTASKWGHATFSEDSDGKVASKFMRLMGIKSAPKPGNIEADTNAEKKKGPDVKSRQAMFSNMEQQYEVARQVTHTMRGVGLGFGSQSRQY